MSARSVRVLLGTAMLFLTALPTRAQDLADQGVQEPLTEAVKAILPDGWKVTKTTAHVTPPDWHTNHPDSGFLVEGGNGKETFKVYFLPLDWIGIRKVPNNAPSCYWEGILAGEKFKTITASSDTRFPERVQELFGRSMSTPSLVNSGYSRAMQIFGGNLKEVDETAEALIRKHCTTPREVAEAVHSLVVLGVPAKKVFLRAAREVEGMDKDFFCSALGYLGGDDAIGVLCEVLADARVEDMRRKYAAMALYRHTDKRIGPALHTALKQMRDSEALGGVARGLARLRYEPAGPDLLEALERVENLHFKTEIANALASLRYQKAAPELQRLLKELPRGGRATPDELRDLELALARLTGEWGKPAEGVRILLVPPREAVVGQKMGLTIFVENIGDEPFYAGSNPRPGLVIDGKSRDNPFQCKGHLRYYDPGEVQRMEYDLAETISAPGRHTVRYTAHGAESKEITVEVRPAKP